MFKSARLLVLLPILNCNPTVPKTITQDNINNVKIVNAFCNARQSFDAGEMEKYIADTFCLISEDGIKKRYDRAAAYQISDWEKEMHTEWRYEILGADRNVVTVLLKEYNDYYSLMGLGSGIQLLKYYLQNGKISQSVSKLFITESGTQTEAYHEFTKWLFHQPGLSEPGLVNTDGSLSFTGKSAPRMYYWLSKWNHLQRKE